MGGPFVSTIVSALEGAGVGGGLSALGEGFNHLEIPMSSIAGYETAIKDDHFVVLVQGNSDEVAKAKTALATIDKQKKEFQDYS